MRIEPKRLMWLVSTLLIGLFALGGAARAEEVTLNYLGWYDETIPEVIEEFQAKYGVKVNFKNFESNEEAFNILRSNPTAWDLVAGDDYWPQRYYEQGLTQEFDPTEMTSWSQLYPEFRKFALDTWAGKTPGSVVAYPGTWGDYQVTVLNGKVQHKLASWADLWDPAYKGRIMISGQGNEMPALTALGMGIPLKSVYDLTADQLKPVVNRLIELKPNVCKIYANLDEIGASMKQEDTWIAPTWSAAMANQLGTQGISAEAYVPGGKTVGWVNCVMATAATQHKKQALEFINFFYSKEMRLVRWQSLQVGEHVSEANAEFVQYLKSHGDGSEARYGASRSDLHHGAVQGS